MAFNSDTAGRESNRNFRVKIWGARGTLPVSGENFRKYGGNTICIEVRCGDHVLLFDAGSGLHPAGMALRAEGVTDVDLFVSIWSAHLAGAMTTREMLKDFMSPPCFPVPL